MCVSMGEGVWVSMGEGYGTGRRCVILGQLIFLSRWENGWGMTWVFIQGHGCCALRRLECCHLSFRLVEGNVYPGGLYSK